MRASKKTDGFRGTRILRFFMCVNATKVLIPRYCIFHNLPLDLRKIQNLFFSIELSFTNIVPRCRHVEFQLANITGKKTTLTHITTTTQHNDNDNNDDDDDDDEDDDNDDDDDDDDNNTPKLWQLNPPVTWRLLQRRRRRRRR